MQSSPTASSCSSRLRNDPLIGELAAGRVTLYLDTTREDQPAHGPHHAAHRERPPVHADLGIAPLDPETDRVMICGSMAMLKDVKTLVEGLGFVEGSQQRPERVRRRAGVRRLKARLPRRLHSASVVCFLSVGGSDGGHQHHLRSNRRSPGSRLQSTRARRGLPSHTSSAMTTRATSFSLRSNCPAAAARDSAASASTSFRRSPRRIADSTAHIPTTIRAIRISCTS